MSANFPIVDSLVNVPSKKRYRILTVHRKERRDRYFKRLLLRRLFFTKFGYRRRKVQKKAQPFSFALHGVAPVRLGLPRVKNLYVLFRRRLHTRYRKLVVKFNQRNFFARVFGRRKRRLRSVLRFWNIPEKLRKKHSLFFFFLKHRKEAAKKRVRLGRQFVLSLRKAQQLLLAKKKRKGLHFFRTASFVLVKRTVNNFFLTAYDAAGATLTSFSSGAAGWQGSKRVNLQSTEAVGKQLMHKLKKRNLDFSRVVVVLRTRLDRLARAAIKGLVDNGMQISLFLFAAKLCHNGIRGRKLRRV